MTDLESIVSEMLDILAERKSVSLHWSEPGSHFAVWDSDGQLQAYFNLFTTLDASRRPAVESLAAEFGLKCKKVTGTDAFDRLQLDLPTCGPKATEVLQRVLTDVFRIENWSAVQLSRGFDV